MSSYTKTTEDFITKFKKLMDDEGYPPQQVFNYDETRLSWKKMSKRTFITAKEVKMPGLKPMRDSLTLLFRANTSEDLKMKLLFVHHTENPWAIK